jgi:phenylacetate-coenzyme A ligase PaaK-like adenylate-forming protein
MIKYKQQPVREIFDNLKSWEEHKHLTLFKNKSELDSYQKYYLKKLLNNKQQYEPKWMLSSGTTSNIAKNYRFPNKFYDLIENHHIWRIMNSHKINAGNVVRIFQGTSTNSTNNFIGPIKMSSVGLMNDCWNLIYEPYKADEKFWKKILNKINELNPVFLYTSPSVFSSFHKEIKQFNFPVIFSCEMLTDPIRKKSELFFGEVIDKMRDWTTGFGFFECPFKTRHLYDDLCLVSLKESNKIHCTDFFNYCNTIPEPLEPGLFDLHKSNFTEKQSDDIAKIKQTKCNCGIFGNTLIEFEGKFFEHIVSVNGKKYSSNYISNALSSIKSELLEYKIIQNKDKSIEFSVKNKLSNEDVILIANMMNNIIMDDGNKLSILADNKIIFNSFDCNLYIKFKTENNKLHRNKMISLRSYVED